MTTFVIATFFVSVAFALLVIAGEYNDRRLGRAIHREVWRTFHGRSPRRSR